MYERFNFITRISMHLRQCRGGGGGGGGGKESKYVSLMQQYRKHFNPMMIGHGIKIREIRQIG